jgi:hypothetical protein
MKFVEEKIKNGVEGCMGDQCLLVEESPKLMLVYPIVWLIKYL